MIKRIEIYNYKGIENFKIDFCNFNLLYGRNAVGKTRILNFIHDFLNFKNSSDVNGKIIFTKIIDNKEYVFEYVLNIENKKVKTFYVKTNYKKTRLSKVIDIEKKVNGDEINEFKFTPSKETFIRYLLTLKDDKNIWFEIIVTFLNTIFYLEQDEDYVPVSYEVDHENNTISINDKYLSNFINNETLKNTYNFEAKQKLDKIIKTLNYFIAKIDFNFKELKLNYEIIIEDDNENEQTYYLKNMIYVLKNNLQFDLKNPILKTNISRGIRHFIHIFENIIKLIINNEEILIIDEFDSYLHDELYNKIVNFLLDYVEENLNKQIITITHNTSSMYMLNKKYIKLIDIDENSNIVAREIKGSFLNNNSNIEKMYRDNIFTNPYIYDSDFAMLKVKKS